MARRCNIQLKLPDASNITDVILRCGLPKGHDAKDPTHGERGRIRASDGKIYTYSIEWQEAPTEVWRESDRRGVMPC